MVELRLLGGESFGGDLPLERTKRRGPRAKMEEA